MSFHSGPKAFLIGAVFADTYDVRRRAVAIANAAWESLRVVVPPSTPFEMGWVSDQDPANPGKWRPLDWATAREEYPGDFGVIKVSSKARWPRTSSEIIDFRLPLEVALLAGRGMVRLVGYAFPRPAPSPEMSDALAASLRSLLLGWVREGDVQTGLVTFDDAIGMLFPYEKAVGLPPFGVDWSRNALGYYWGNLLTSGHLESMRRAEIEPPEGIVAENGQGWLWLQLDQPLTRCDREALQRMRDLLSPVLPIGRRTVEEYFAEADGDEMQVEDLCL